MGDGVACVSNLGVPKLAILIRSFGLARKIPTLGNSGFFFYLWRRYDLNGRKSRNHKIATHRRVVVYDKNL